MKKILAILSVVIVAAGVLVGCAEKCYVCGKNDAKKLSAEEKEHYGVNGNVCHECLTEMARNNYSLYY